MMRKLWLTGLLMSLQPPSNFFKTPYCLKKSIVFAYKIKQPESLKQPAANDLSACNLFFIFIWKYEFHVYIFVGVLSILLPARHPNHQKPGNSSVFVSHSTPYKNNRCFSAPCAVRRLFCYFLTAFKNPTCKKNSLRKPAPAVCVFQHRSD